MRNFSIRHLENFSDIKAHTIRIWEQRFGILTPQRSNGNIRNYSLSDVRLFLNIALLVKHGAKISELAQTDNLAIAQRIKSLTAEKARRNKVISHLIVCMFSNDIEQFEDILDSCILSWDVDITIKELIVPFLEKVQLLSYNDSSCETHFAVTAIRRKLILGLERVDTPVMTNKSALLFLAEGEHYDLILLYISYILKKNGIKVFYLGTNISKPNVEIILRLKKPNYLVTYIPQKQKFKLHSLLPFLNEHFPETNFIIAGCEKMPVIKESTGNVTFMHYRNLESMPCAG